MNKAQKDKLNKEAQRLATDFDEILKSVVLLRVNLEQKLNDVIKFEDKLRTLVKIEEDKK